MKQGTFTLTIARVHESLFSGEAVSVTVPGSEGQFTVLAHHAPLISQLKAGTITVKTGTETHEFPIEKGMLETSNNQAIILI